MLQRFREAFLHQSLQFAVCTDLQHIGVFIYVPEPYAQEIVLYLVTDIAIALLKHWHISGNKRVVIL